MLYGSFRGGGGSRKKKAAEDPDLGITILPGDVLDRNVDKWIAEMRRKYGEYARYSGTLRKASTRDRLARATYMIETLNEAVGITGHMGPRADEKADRNTRFERLERAVAVPLEKAIRAVYDMLPMPPDGRRNHRGLLKLTDEELDAMGLKIDKTITHTFGPHFPLKALKVIFSPLNL